MYKCIKCSSDCKPDEVYNTKDGIVCIDCIDGYDRVFDVDESEALCETYDDKGNFIDGESY